MSLQLFDLCSLKYGMKDLLPYFLDMEQDIARAKDPKKAEAFFSKLCWDTLTCKEAEKIFPEMLQCPVCMKQAEKVGDVIKLYHRPKSLIWN